MGTKKNDGRNPNLQVLIQPNIGLESDDRHAVLKILDHTLTKETLLTVKTRTVYWHVRGTGFFERRIFFDSQYQQLNQISEKIAERILELDGIAGGGLQEFFEYINLNAQSGDTPNTKGLLTDHEVTIRFLRENAKKCSVEFGDEVTHHLLVTVLYQHEKMAWMLRSYVETELPDDKSFVSSD